ncbi:MAG TPA: hypothetical protein VME40_06140 [Caulobacteraceae bacterium]|nr:hypothetical protein [Caulobacteraceae bacterium]
MPRGLWSAISALGLAALALPTPASAVTRHDARAVQALYKRSLDLTQALTDAVGGGVSQLNATGDAQTLDCLDTLREAASEVSDQLMDVQDVATLAASLRHAPDRRYGVVAARKAAARALDVLPVEAKQINATASLCLTQTLVQQKARDGLLLIDDATPALKRLTR